MARLRFSTQISKEAVMKYLAYVIGIVLLSSPAFANDLIVDNPGFCNANDGEQELADMTSFTPTSIDSHLSNCAWTRKLNLKPGLDTTVRAKCYMDGQSFKTRIHIKVNDQWRVQAFGDAGTGLPEFYFPCARWGYKH
jgi:hypothetical protein